MLMLRQITPLRYFLFSMLMFSFSDADIAFRYIIFAASIIFISFRRYAAMLPASSLMPLFLRARYALPRHAAIDITPHATMRYQRQQDVTMMP